MKLKYFMRGLGIGIIVTSIVLMISFNNSTKKELSDMEIIEKATALGMEMKDKGIDLERLKSTNNNNTDNSVTDDSNKDETSVDETNVDDTSVDETNTINDQNNKDDNLSTQASKADDKDNDVDSNQEKPNISDNVDSTSEENSQSKTQDTTLNENEEFITIKISLGMYSKEVTKQLKDKGLIEREDNFNEYIAEHKAQTRIRVGTYHIPKGATNSEILRIITKSKK